MSLHTIRWSSKILGKATETHVIFPDAGEPPFPVLYLLHGLSDDSSMWLRRTRLEAYAEPLPLIIVMPDGYRGWYTDNDHGPSYAEHIGEELPAFIERAFPACRDRSARAVSGLSMGGYGALRIGLGYHDRFCSIHSHSGAVGWGRNGKLEQLESSPEADPDFIAELRRIFGSSPEGSDHDLLALAKRAKKARQLPKILLDCGTSDFLLSDNRAFVQDLEAAKIPHAYREHPGGHDWGYWDTHIQEALSFHMGNLKRAASRVPGPSGAAAA
ncbi:MAG: alpha/beta hydrolase family protein [Verrucomicrobiae bacterium]